MEGVQQVEFGRGLFCSSTIALLHYCSTLCMYPVLRRYSYNTGSLTPCCRKHVFFSLLILFSSYVQYCSTLIRPCTKTLWIHAARSQIHERTISLRLLAMLRVEVSIYNVYMTNRFQNTFGRRGRGEENSLVCYWVIVNSKDESSLRLLT